MNTSTKLEGQTISFNEYNSVFKNEKESTSVRLTKKVGSFLKDTVFFMKYMYFVVLLVMVLGVLFEIKCIYNIDVFRDINTPFDTYYNEAKGNLTADLR
ncbi:MAG: hypothetical protein ACEQSR_11115 [Candidatus Methylacidiphilales bacterium]